MYQTSSFIGQRHGGWETDHNALLLRVPWDRLGMHLPLQLAEPTPGPPQRVLERPLRAEHPLWAGRFTGWLQVTGRSPAAYRLGGGH